MSCICAKETDEYHGWECEITGGACMYLRPNQDACADKYGEIEHTKGYCKRNGIYSSVKAIAKRSGVEKNIYPHLFRKTTATNIVKRGGSVSDAGEYLGHADRSTAGRHYAYRSENHTMRIFAQHVAAV